MKKFIEEGYAETLKIIGIFLTAGSMIVAITLFIADRPTRAEVRETIDKAILTRFESLEHIADKNADKIDAIYKMLIDKK